MKRVEWVIVLEGNYPGLCTRCGAKLHLPLPQPLLVWTAAAFAFVRLHKDCKEK